MIVGVGTDIVNIERVNRILTKYSERFIERICRKSEIVYLGVDDDKKVRLAKIWAVKEAAVKALGTGFINGINFTDIELKHDLLGKPEISFYGKAKDVLLEKINEENLNVWVSLSDDKPFAQALVIIEKI